MADMNTEFVGGELAGQSRSPIDENELATLGYRPARKWNLQGTELIYCFAVPITWTPTEEKQAIDKRLNKGDFRKPGKQSV